MAKIGRNELRQRFRIGRMPSESDFSDLIDSMVNSEDEGFAKSPEDGLKLSQLTDFGRLMSFYENVSAEEPLWYSEMHAEREGASSILNLTTPEASKNLGVITFKGPASQACSCPERSSVGVGINCRNPESELDVNGTVTASCRLGRQGKLEVPADGKWHDITEDMTGLQAFEIMAGVGGKDGDGKFALTHAVALCVFGSKPKIQETKSYSGWRGNRIDVRFVKGVEKFHFKLQLRTKCSYGEGVNIRYRMTSLWNDHLMESSLVASDGN